MNIDEVRTNMIKQQLRTCDVSDSALLDIFATIPREQYVPKAYRDVAYADSPIPIGHDQIMLAPTVDARIAQALAIKAKDNILEIGTGTGYLTTVLAKLGKSVTTVDIYPEFTSGARTRLHDAGIHNVEFFTDNAANGFGQDTAFHVIVMTSSMYKIPKHFLQQLPVGGRLFAIVGQEPAMHATIVTRGEAGQWSSQSLFETSAPALIDGVQAEKFKF